MACALGVVLLLATGGCATMRRHVTPEQIAKLSPARPIVVYTRDDREYRLRRHALVDSVLEGEGKVVGWGTQAPFQGRIPLDQIVAVRAGSRDALKTLALVGVTVVFAAYVHEAATSDGGLNAAEGRTYHTPISGGGSSCPYVYAWDGEGYRLQAEPFGIAWGKALELTALQMLPAARAEHGVVRLRLTNEREETHYVNAIGLRAVDLGGAPAAVLDDAGTAWPLWHPVAPAEVRERSGRDILAEVAEADGRMWECDPGSLTPDAGYEDVLEVTFARPHDAGTGLLVVTGVNTSLSMAFQAQVFQMAGDRTPVLAHAIETDPELIAELRGYLRDASLQASVWNGRDWEPAGAIQPEASAVTFTRALRIQVPKGAGETVRVRLRSMADVWKVDAIAAEWGDAAPLAMKPLEMRSAIGPDGEDLRGAIGAEDDRYAILLPPDRVELTFAAADDAGGHGVAYAVAGRGYLHEWEPREAEGGAAAVAAQVPGEQRVAFVKELLKHRERFMQPVYEAWRRERMR
ncbi:MAG: hypothetical protein A2V63_13785 [Candidatus Eisenbacteria bacterium RBG_19FT_COMBO_70_11]|nr:MAG: hypothetical protein A2V63_13785 [Candidatus Eisenbacteria bacterium RBG_19FT_COMBO_70_11]